MSNVASIGSLKKSRSEETTGSKNIDGSDIIRDCYSNFSFEYSISNVGSVMVYEN